MSSWWRVIVARNKTKAGNNSNIDNQSTSGLGILALHNTLQLNVFIDSSNICKQSHESNDYRSQIDRKICQRRDGQAKKKQGLNGVNYKLSNNIAAIPLITQAYDGAAVAAFAWRIDFAASAITVCVFANNLRSGWLHA